MSGAIAASRASLAELLTGAGVRVAEGVTGPIAAPCVVITPGEPWLERGKGLTGTTRIVRWRLILVGGLLDQDGTLTQLEDMIDRIVPAIAFGRWELPTTQLSGPHRLPQDGATYLTCELLAGQLVTLAAPVTLEGYTDG